jgi:hypothetical protein
MILNNLNNLNIMRYISNDAIKGLNYISQNFIRNSLDTTLYVIKFVSDLRQVGGFLWVFRFPLPIKLAATRYNWNIVVLNTITLMLTITHQKFPRSRNVPVLQLFYTIEQNFTFPCYNTNFKKLRYQFQEVKIYGYPDVNATIYQ